MPTRRFQFERLVALAAVSALIVMMTFAQSDRAYAVGTITFDGTPGLAAPPSTLGPYTMTPVPVDANLDGVSVGSIPAPGGTIAFSQNMTTATVPAGGWKTWSHNYASRVYDSGTANSITLTLPANTVAFYLYTEQDTFGVNNFTVSAQDGTTSGPVAVDSRGTPTGSLGAKYFGFYAQGGASIQTISISVDGNPSGLAVGEFGIATAAELSVTKTDSPDPVTAGQNVSYTLTVNNAGPSDASSVSLSDTLPAGLTFVSVTPAVGWACTGPAVGNPGTINCTKPSLATGSEVITLVAKVAASVAAGTVVSNTATVSSLNPDTDGANNSATSTTTVAASADLSATKTDTPDPVAAGANVTYTITVTNAGPSDAQAYSVSDILPGGTSLVSVTQITGPPTGTALPAGATATFTIVAKVSASTAAGTILTNTVSTGSSTTDPNAANNSATATTTVTTSADVSVTKTDSPDPVVAGETITYSITVTNNGPSDAQAYSLSDVLPSGTSLVSVTQISGPPTGSTLPAGGSATFEIKAAVAANVAGGTVLSNTATASSTTSDPTPGNNSATATTTVGRTSDLSVTKDASPIGPVVPGTPITYTLHVTNAGPSVANANSLTVTDTLPAGFSNVVFGATSPWTCTASLPTITCTRTGASMPIGTEDITFTVTTNPSTTTGNFVNNANVTVTAGGGQNADPTPGNNTGSASNVVAPPRADLSVAKAISNTVPVPGSTVTYRIRVRNQGPSTAVNVTMTDPIPAGYVFQGWTGGTPAGCNNPSTGSAAPTLTCTTASMLPGSSYLVTFTATVPASPDGRTRNTATVSSPTLDPVQSNNKAVEAASLP